MKIFKKWLRIAEIVLGIILVIAITRVYGPFFDLKGGRIVQKTLVIYQEIDGKSIQAIERFKNLNLRLAFAGPQVAFASTIIPEIRVTNGPGDESAWPQKKKVAVSGNYVYAVWQDNRNWLTSGFDIWFNRSTDGGGTWDFTKEQRLTDNPCNQFNGEIMATGSTVYVFWTDDRDGLCDSWGMDNITGYHKYRTEIYYRKSTDYGATWGPEVRVTYYNSAKYLSGDIEAIGNNVYVAWNDSRNNSESTSSNHDIFFTMSSDSGINWLPEKRLTSKTTAGFTGGVSCSGKNAGGVEMAVSGGIVFVVWEDLRNQATKGADVWSRRSQDNGMTWEREKRLTSFSGNERKPVVAASGSNFIVAWEDDRAVATNGISLAYIRSIDNGTTWSKWAWMAISTGSNKCDHMFVASGNYWYGVWTDTRNQATSGLDLFYKYSLDGGLTWNGGLGGIQLTSEVHDQYSGSLAADMNVLNVIWEDTRNPGTLGVVDLWYKKLTF